MSSEVSALSVLIRTFKKVFVFFSPIYKILLFLHMWEVPHLFGDPSPVCRWPSFIAFVIGIGPSHITIRQSDTELQNILKTDEGVVFICWKDMN